MWMVWLTFMGVCSPQKAVTQASTHSHASLIFARVQRLRGRQNGSVVRVVMLSNFSLQGWCVTTGGFPNAVIPDAMQRVRGDIRGKLRRCAFWSRRVDPLPARSRSFASAKAGRVFVPRRSPGDDDWNVWLTVLREPQSVRGGIRRLWRRLAQVSRARAWRDDWKGADPQKLDEPHAPNVTPMKKGEERRSRGPGIASQESCYNDGLPSHKKNRRGD